MLQNYMDMQQKLILDAWREKAKQWTVGTKHAYNFVRHKDPVKSCVLRKGDRVTCHPSEVEDVLNDYWVPKESWPDGMCEETALGHLEDHYSIYLPWSQCALDFLPSHLCVAIKTAKVSSSGLDSWTIQELKSLPRAAIEALWSVLVYRWDTVQQSLAILVKRVPIGKGGDPLDPSNTRPIDVFSCILRAFSSALYSLIQPWARSVLHPAQYATSAGAFAAASYLAVRVELSLEKFVPTYAVSCDFAKMFNMMSCGVACKSAEYMGLDPYLIDLIQRPLRAASFVWRLPFSGLPTIMQHQRGLPQGMASSVLLAECAIAP